MNLGSFICHIYWSENCQLSVLHTGRNDHWFQWSIGEKSSMRFVDRWPDCQKPLLNYERACKTNSKTSGHVVRQLVSIHRRKLVVEIKRVGRFVASASQDRSRIAGSTRSKHKYEKPAARLISDKEASKQWFNTPLTFRFIVLNIFRLFGKWLRNSNLRVSSE